MFISCWTHVNQWWVFLHRRWLKKRAGTAGRKRPRHFCIGPWPTRCDSETIFMSGAGWGVGWRVGWYHGINHGINHGNVMGIKWDIFAGYFCWDYNGIMMNGIILRLYWDSNSAYELCCGFHGILMGIQWGYHGMFNRHGHNGIVIFIQFMVMITYHLMMGISWDVSEVWSWDISSPCDQLGGCGQAVTKKRGAAKRRHEFILETGMPKKFGSGAELVERCWKMLNGNFRGPLFFFMGKNHGFPVQTPHGPQ